MKINKFTVHNSVFILEFQSRSVIPVKEGGGKRVTWIKLGIPISEIFK